jgi:hydrophobic/amphiphilic exporter-1 (mainly G- bacteria), HAE1 family
MTWLTKFSLKNRSAVIILAFLISLAGVLTGTKLPMEFLPNVDSPVISVSTIAQGLDAKTLKETVTEPIEKAIGGTKGLEEMNSETRQGISFINMSFNTKTNMKEAAREIESQINKLPLPTNIGKPYVSQINMSQAPVAQFFITKNNQNITIEDENKIKKDIIPQIEAIEGVSAVIIFGSGAEEIHLTLNQDQLAKHQVTGLQVMSALQGKDLSMPVGELKTNGETNSLRVVSDLSSITDIENITILPNVKIKDVADVKLEKQEDAVTHVNGKLGMALAVQVEPGANSVAIGNEYKEVIKDLQKEYKGEYHFETFSLTSDTIYNSVMGMAREVGLGALFATIIILFFLRNVKTTIIAVVSIPLSIFLTLFLLSRFGISLNTMTLGGMAVAVGRLVDDSIVVIENIYRRLQNGERSKEMIVDAVKEVAGAITSSTLTTIAVFLPIGLVEGFVGLFFMPFALTVVFSLLASLLVSLTIVPLMAYKLLKNVKPHEEKQPKKYLAILNWSLNHKFIVILLCILMFGGSIAAYASIPTAAVSQEDQTFVSTTLTYPTSTTKEEVLKGTEKLVQFILEQKNIENVFSLVGTSSEQAKWGTATYNNVGTIYINLKDGRKADDFVKAVKAQQKHYEPAVVSVTSMTSGAGNTLSLKVFAENPADLGPSATKLLEKVKKIDGLEKVESNYQATQSEWVIHINQEKVEKSALTPDQVAQQIQALTGKTPVGMVTFDEKNLPIIMEFNLENVENQTDLLNSTIVSPMVGPIKLKDLVTIKEEQTQTSFFHSDGKEYYEVTAVITGKDLKKVSIDVDKAVNDLNFGKGIEVKTGGATADQMSQFGDLFQTMAMAIGIVYLVMVVTFGQARAPFAILFSLPLAAVGAILGLLISRIPLDINSLVGALMLIGIVVTNAIVFIDRVHQQKELGFSTREALLEAGATRLRPIVMTAVATVCAMLPMLFHQSDAGAIVSVGQSLAVVVIGGLTVSTILTLIVVPVIYEMLDRIGKKKQPKVDKKLAALVATKIN